jgi:tetratricopeptide (TPR) repeat protein
MADRYTYLPLIGLAIAVAWGVWDLVSERRPASVAAGISALAVLAALSVASALQIETWRDTETMAAHALEVTSLNGTAHFLLASALLDQGRKDEARSQLEAAIALHPKRGEYRGLLGQILEKEGQPENAVAAYYDALRLEPALPATRARLAQALIELDRSDEALAVLEKGSANSRESGGAEFHALMGRALERRGDLVGAVTQYEVALGFWPDFPEAHGNLGLVLAKQNRLAEAETHLRRALSLGLDTPELYLVLGDMLQRQGKMREAADAFRTALGLRPDWEIPSNNLAWILATDKDPTLRRPLEAVALAEGAAGRTHREEPGILDTLAVAYAAAGRRADALATAREALAKARAQQRNDLIPVLDERVHSYEDEGSAGHEDGRQVSPEDAEVR